MTYPLHTAPHALATHQTTSRDLKPNMNDAKLLAEALKDQNKDYKKGVGAVLVDICVCSCMHASACASSAAVPVCLCLCLSVSMFCHDDRQKHFPHPDLDIGICILDVTAECDPFCQIAFCACKRSPVAGSPSTQPTQPRACMCLSVFAWV